MRGKSAASAARHGLDGFDHPIFRIVEPLVGKSVQGAPADFLSKSQHLPLANKRGAQHGQKISMPLIGHADSHTTHADDVINGLVILNHFNGGEDQCTFFIHVPGGAVIGCRN